jgi:serine/threonine protein kinase
MIEKTLGHYQITSQLGKGGMGEVYQAKDQKLERDVAIKVLPEEFAKDADHKLKKIAINGGAPVVLCDVTNPLNGSWGADDTIVYAEREKGIVRISSNGGTPELLVKTTGLYLVNPQILPDGKAALFGIVRDLNSMPTAVQSLKSGEDERLSSGQLPQAPWSWSRDGKTLLLMEAAASGGTNSYIVTLSMEGDHNRMPLLQEKHNEGYPKISPDGRWMAYASEESGKTEVYVRPFPDANKGKWQVSTSGGLDPLWSPDGRELFYRNGDSVMAAAVQTETTFNAGKTEALFQGKYDSSWDISHDGKRFLMIKPPTSTGAAATATGPRKIIIVLNWFEELKQRVPVK